MNLRSAWDGWVDSAVRPRVAILRFLPVAGSRIIGAIVAANLVAGALPVAFVVATSVVIGRVPAAVDGGLGSPAWDSLVLAFVLAALAFLASQALAPVLVALNAALRRRVDGHLRDQIFELTARTTSIAPLEDAEVLDELAETSRQFDNDWHTPGQAAGGMLALVARYSSLVAFCALLSASASWWSGPVVLGATMVFRYGNRGGLRKYSRVWRTVMPASRSYDYLRELAMGEVAAKETRVFGLDDWLGGRYTDTHWKVFGPVAAARRRIYFYPYLGYTAFGVLVASVVVVDTGLAAASGEISLTALALALQATTAAIALGGYYPEADTGSQFGMRAVEALTRLRERIETYEATERATARPVRTDVDVTRLPSTSLRLADVAFAYPGSERVVLDGLELEIPAGRSTAIVGVNGAGKTTLVKLLTRLYEPTRGAILADGVDIAELDPVAWRRQVSVIFQDFVRLELSAADNIALGAVHAPRDEDALWEAARRAGIAEVLEDLPAGLDTPLARAYEGGIDLSGGQWQRIAIARSLYAVAHGARVLVLDEPTSALDVRAEVAFFDRFVELTRGVTSILVSHRFSSVRRADHVVVIEHGKVVERGSHAELMAADGTYARLFRLQAERFAQGLDAEGEHPDYADPDAVVDLAEVAE